MTPLPLYEGKNEHLIILKACSVECISSESLLHLFQYKTAPYWLIGGHGCWIRG